MSRIKAISSITLIAVMFFSGLVVCAQQTPPDNATKIRELRSEIQKREEENIPEDLKDINLSILIERRAQLRTALKAETDALKRRRVELGTFIAPEEDQQITAKVDDYEAEIRKLGTSIQGELGATNPQPSPSPVVTATPMPQFAPTPSLVQPISSKSAASPPPKINCTDVSNLTAEEQKTIPEVEHKICEMVRVLRDRKDQGRARLTLDSSDPTLTETPDLFDLLVVLIAKKSTPTFLVEAEEARTDKQMGTEPSSGGSTSLVVKGGAPAVLGFAVENGALARNVDKNTVTFRGNPLGLVRALQNKGLFSSAIEDEKDPVTNFLRKTSFAFSFDTNRGTQPGTLTATSQQLSSFSARIELINKRKPTLYLKEWNDFLSKQVQAFSNNLSNSASVLLTTDITTEPLRWRDAALNQWYADTQAALAGASKDEMEAVFRARLDKLPVADLSPTTVAQLNGIEESIGAYLAGRDSVLDKIAKGTLVTFEYTNKREVTAPDTSNFRFIAEKGTGGRVDFTFNASLTMFNNLGSLRNFVNLNPTLAPPRRLRDFQFAGQVDYPLGSVRNFGQFVLFAGGRYERLLENAPTDLGMILPNTKGDIGYLQLGVKVPIKGTGFKIPFSVTFANRTELVKEKTVRGNFGFSLDLDTLFAKFKPF